MKSINLNFELPYFLCFRLRDVTLDIAEDRQTRQDRAYAVEQCVCPVGYRGLSCEDCDTGYTRSGSGLYLGLCVPCNCNGHSSECDPETGVCRVRISYFEIIIFHWVLIFVDFMVKFNNKF